MTHSLDYMQWCLERLSPQEYVTYLVIQQMYFRDLPEAENLTNRKIHFLNTTQVELSSLTHLNSHTTIKKHLRTLQSKGFIQYVSTHHDGTDIFWVRKSRFDRPLSDQTIKKYISVEVRSPKGEIKIVRKNEFSKFCKEHGLDFSGFYRMRMGMNGSHKGWTLVTEERKDALHTN